MSQHKRTFPKSIKVGPQSRGVTLARDAVNVDARTLDLAFSSEYPVERWFGMEVLSHEPGAMRTGRMEDGAPLLLNHDQRQQVGVVESVEVGDSKGRAQVRFGRSALAEEALNDVADGVK